MRKYLPLLLPALFAVVSLHSQAPAQKEWHVVTLTPASDINLEINEAVESYMDNLIVVFTPGTYYVTETVDLSKVKIAYGDGADVIPCADIPTIILTSNEITMYGFIVDMSRPCPDGKMYPTVGISDDKRPIVNLNLYEDEDSPPFVIY